ncbi:MAG: T9SS type A sorting domain-containing protein [Ignavibacteria bacterium]|nr:T9SS type A sorting domain-containing protein [Ignavibacteria bacterium]
MKNYIFLLFFFTTTYLFGQTLIWQSTNPQLSGNTTVVHLAPNGWLFAGSFANGVYVSSDKGKSWVTRNKGLTSTQIFAFLNVRDTMYVGTLNGVYKSTNLGTDWFSVNNGLTDNFINTLAVTRDRRLLAGTLYSGLFISADYGNSWTQMKNDFQNKSVNCILTKPDGFVLVGTTSGLYRATLLFDFWGKVDADFKNNNNINTLALDSSGNIYAGTNNGMIFKSTNNGVNWTMVVEIPNTSIYRIISTPYNSIFAATYGKGVFRSTNFGATWEEVNDGLNNPYTTCIVSLPTREYFVSTWGSGVFYGQEFTISTSIEGEYCTGSEVLINYYVTQEFNPDNYFVAQLSDNNGSFANPTELGRIQSRTSGTIVGRIPTTVPSGILYRIRVVSTSPSIVGSDNRKNIRIYKGLAPTINGNNNVCQEDIITYEGSIKPGVISIWYISNGEILNIDTVNNKITIKWNSVGDGEVMLLQKLSDGKCPDSTKITVRVNPKPEKPTITRRGYFLYSSSKTGNQWFLFNNPIPNATADSILLNEPGIYYVQVTNQFGCKSDLSDGYDFYFNIAEDVESNKFQIFPNPTSNFVKAYYPDNSFSLVVTDILGNERIQINLSPTSPNPITLSLNNLHSGTYFVTVKTLNGYTTRKLVILQ